MIKELELIKSTKDIIKNVTAGVLEGIEFDTEIILPVPLTGNEVVLKAYTQVRGEKRYRRCEKYVELFGRIKNKEVAEVKTIEANLAVGSEF